MTPSRAVGRWCLVAAATAGGLGTLLLGATPAGASAPDRLGWWSRAAVVPGAAAPAPPGAGLVVQNDPSGPTAYSAVHYAGVGSSGPATLTLTSANGDITLPPGAGLAACPVTKTGWTAEAGGPIADAPTYATAGCATGTAAGPTVTFTVPAAAQSTPGALDLAIVPTGSAPFLVGFATPATSSLAAPDPDAPSTSVDTSSSSGAGAATPSGASGTAAATSAGLGTSSSANATGDLGLGGTTAPSPSLGLASPTPSFDGTSATRPGAAVRRPPTPSLARSVRDSSRSDRLLAVAVLAAIVGGLWWLGGAPVRQPRLLGSLGGGGTDTPEVGEPVRTGGIGRFARPRSEAPKRLA